ncbi:MAG: VWA domain-containing protein, partial [Acidimicrobiia bacterium]|nr:VWA domain-containing protein [Acidimicrobiia bacterium]
MFTSDFLAPERLWLLLGVVVLAVAHVAVSLMRGRAALRFTQVELLDRIAPKRPGWRRHVVAGAQLLGLSAAVVAVAQPVNREIIRPETEGRIMVLFDVSLSMMATDVPPDRLTAAQEEALAFVDAVRDDVEIGLISFSGTVNVEQQPTRDRLDVKRSIENLELAEATAIGDALATGVRVLTSSLDSGEGGDTGENATDVSPGVIVLMTDGETTFGRTSNEGAELAADANIPVFTIAFGTADGEIEDPYTGDIVPVPAQPEALEEVADISGGEAFEAGSETELADAYGQIDELLQETIGEEEEIVAEQAWKWALTAAGVLTGAWLLS